MSSVAVTFVLDRVGGSRPPDAVVTRRRAVRAVVRRGDELLLIATDQGDVKFPGGGVDPGESDAAAVARELAEEAGAVAATVGSLVCTVLERRPDRDGSSVFEMTSCYYEVAITQELVPTRLEDYEADLGMHPVWTHPAAALAANADHAALLDRPAPWVHREMTVLGHLLTAGERMATGS